MLLTEASSLGDSNSVEHWIAALGTLQLRKKVPHQWIGREVHSHASKYQKGSYLSVHLHCRHEKCSPKAFWLFTVPLASLLPAFQKPGGLVSFSWTPDPILLTLQLKARSTTEPVAHCENEKHFISTCPHIYNCMKWNLQYNFCAGSHSPPHFSLQRHWQRDKAFP